MKVFNRVVKKIKEKRLQLPLGIFTIVLIVILGFWQTTNMYFRHDDYTILYKIQNPDETTGALGSGILGRDSPYRYAAIPWVFLYPFIGIQSTGYYVALLVLYAVSAIPVYLLAKSLTKNRATAFISTLIFVSGYVGSDKMYHLATGFQSILGVIFLATSVFFYNEFIQKKKSVMYIVSLVAFFLSIEVVFIRSHGILFLILGLELIFNFNRLKSFIRMIPFISIWCWVYLINPPSLLNIYPVEGEYSGYFLNKVFNLVNNDKSFGENIIVFKSLLNTLQNVFIPNKLTFPLPLFLISLSLLFLWKKSKLILYLMLFIFFNYFVYFLYNPEQILTTHRYLTNSFIGASILIAVILKEILNDNRRQIVVCFGIVALAVFNLNLDQSRFIKNRSSIAKNLYADLSTDLPRLNKNSAVYIDVKVDGKSKPAFDDATATASMGATAILAVRYKLKADEVYLPATFDELIGLIKEDKVGKNSTYTFFYSIDTGLVDTTQVTKQALSGGKSNVKIQDLTNIGLPSSSPSVLMFNSKIRFIEIEKEDKPSEEPSIENLSQYLSYLRSQDEYYNEVSATASSELRLSEVDNLIDRNIKTSWRGLSFPWEHTGSASVILDLGRPVNVGAIKMQLATAERIPTKYHYECSNNASNWDTIQNVSRKEAKSYLMVIDKLPPASCRFIKFVIENTYSNWDPQISDMEVVQDKFRELDLLLANRIRENPRAYTKTHQERLLLLDHLQANGIDGKICVYTDKNKQTQPDCKSHKFYMSESKRNSFKIEPAGTQLSKIEFEMPPQTKIEIRNTTLEYLSLDELD